MKLKPYPEYKASHIELIGDVPVDWKIQKIGYSFTDRPCYGVLVPDEAPADEGVPMLRITDLKKGTIITRDVVRISKSLSEEYSRTLITAGDIILSVVGTIGEVALVDKEHEGFNLSRALARIQLKKSLDATYICYLVQSKCFTTFVDLTCVGTAQRVLNMADLFNWRVAVPTKEEQIAIASFLDCETAKIDTLIAKQEKLIELLKEKRQAVISHAVTKGLDPTVQMKPSGVEWLGDVPSHWDVKPFGTCFDIVYRYPTYYDIPYIPTGVPEIRGEALAHDGSIRRLDDMRFIASETSDKFPMTRLIEGDLVMSVRGTLGKIGIVTDEFAGSNITANLLRLSPNRAMFDEKFLLWQMLSHQYQEQLDINSSQTTIKTVTVPQLNQTRIAMPPKEEQLAIASYLSTGTAKIDALICKAERAIELQREHRTALISAAVTGKIDVRDSVSDLQEAA